MSFVDSDSLAGGLPVRSSLMVDEQCGFERGYARGPERSLLEALLFDGIQGCLGYVLASSQKAKKRYLEAYRWVFENTEDYVFSFENVCEALGFNPEYIRAGIAGSDMGILEEAKKSRRVA
jgi:hypothetical protein